MVFKRKSYRQVVDSIIKDMHDNSPVSDTNVGSVARTMVEAVGREIATMYEQMQAAYNAGFVDSANGAALDMVVAILGVARKSAQYATGSVTFSRRNANKEVTIPRGTLVSTQETKASNMKIFETSITLTLTRGENEIEVPIKALDPGKDGMADFETITKLESPIIGIDKVINKKPTTIGTERESDEELRARAKAVVLSAGKTTVDSIKNSIMAIPGVRDVSVLDMPEGVPGEIDVIVDGPNLEDPESESYKNVQKAIERVRPAGIQVNLKSTTLVRTSIDIFLNLTDIPRTEEELDGALDSIKDNIADYIESLGSGDNVSRNKMVTAVFKNENVENLQDIKIITRIFDEKIRGLVEDTRKRIDESTRDMEIGEYERAELENISVKTQFTPTLVSYVRVDLNLRVVPTKKTIAEQRIIEGIETQIALHFEKLRTGEPVDYLRVKNLIKGVKGISELLDFSISALYESSGVAIDYTRDNLPIKDDELVKLRDINMEVVD